VIAHHCEKKTSKSFQPRILDTPISTIIFRRLSPWFPRLQQCYSYNSLHRRSTSDVHTSIWSDRAWNCPILRIKVSRWEQNGERSPDSLFYWSLSHSTIKQRFYSRRGCNILIAETRNARNYPAPQSRIRGRENLQGYGYRYSG